jgi:hypothetical protein
MSAADFRACNGAHAWVLGAPDSSGRSVERCHRCGVGRVAVSTPTDSLARAKRRLRELLESVEREQHERDESGEMDGFLGEVVRELRALREELDGFAVSVRRMGI